MIVILKQNTPKPQVQEIINEISAKGVKIHLSEGENTTIIGLVGDTTVIDINHIKAIPAVEDVRRVQEPYKKANRKFHADNTIVDVGGIKIG